MRVKKCIVFVPHQDDEINIIGCLAGELKKANYEIIVVFLTNGDAIPKLAPYRIRESQQVKKILSIDREIFLGYPDTSTPPHIYNSFQTVCSRAGKSETYALCGTVDYSFEKRAAHNKYRRDSLARDISNILNEEMADIIISVDYDSHPDHRALSLIVEECLGEILKKTDYSPIVLKKFAYLGTWDGPADYFSNVLEMTKLEDKTEGTFEERCYPYRWCDRVQIRTPEEIIKVRYWKSPVYKALKVYHSVAGIRKFQNIVNADTVYWYRSTKNLLYHAKVHASSGDVQYLSDFKLIDTDDVCTKAQGLGRFSFKDCVWCPEINDTEKKLDIYLDRPSYVEEIKFHKFGMIKGVEISINDESMNRITFSDDIVDVVKLKQNNVDHILLRFDLINGAGLRELEISPESLIFPWDNSPFTAYNSEVIIEGLQKYKLLYKIANITAKVRKFFIDIITADYKRITLRIKRKLGRMILQKGKRS